MSRLIPLIPALLALGCATSPSAVPVRPDAQLPGTWSGAVSLPNGQLQLIAHLGEDGTGTVDVPQQNAKDLPLRVVKSEGNAFEMISDVPGAPAVLTGTRDGDVLRGTFAQRGYEFPFELRREAIAAKTSGVSNPEPLRGPWHGAVVVGANHLPFEILFDEAATSGTFSVPSQGLRGLKLEEISFDGERIAFRVTLPNGQAGGFDGALKAARVEGTYSQGGGTSPFFMDRGERPAPPKATANDLFEEHEVSFTHGGITLAGTLTLPRNVVRPPVAILISGSGPQDRNEDVAGFKVFEALAHELAKGGMATLRFDDRGIGQSTGDFHTATTLDFADDAEAAVRFLQTRTEIDPKRIGLMGHSEGAVVAPVVASRNGDVAFLVLLAPPAQHMADLVVDQIAPASRAEGIPVETITANERLMRRAVALLREDKDLSSLASELGPMRKQLETPWFRAFVKLDPAPYLTKVKVPTLALAGSLDVQVPGEKNLPLLRKLAGAKKGTFVVEEVTGMNHLLQPAKTGAVSEYATLPRQLEPKVPARILAWLSGALL